MAAATTAPPAATAPAPASRVTDGDLAAWVVEGLTRDSRNDGESAEALLLRNDRRPDLSIANEVTGLLTAAGVQGTLVSCVGGSVEMRGKVVDAARRDKAGALAGGVAGVHAVNNLLHLSGDAPVPWLVARPTSASAVNAGPARMQGLSFLTRDDLAGRGIAVDVEGGVVRLTGEVCSTQARDYATDVAGRVPGVRTVRSELKVRASNLQTDRRLALLIHRSLTNDVVVQTVSNAILVAIENGVLHLVGGVRDEAQRAQAERVAAGFPEVFAVVNELTVDEHLLLPPRGRIDGFKLFDDFGSKGPLSPERP